MPGMTTPSASTYAFTAHCTAGGHIRVRVAPARRQREDSAGIVARATWASPSPSCRVILARKHRQTAHRSTSTASLQPVAPRKASTPERRLGARLSRTRLTAGRPQPQPTRQAAGPYIYASLVPEANAAIAALRAPQVRWLCPGDRLSCWTPHWACAWLACVALAGVHCLWRVVYRRSSPIVRARLTASSRLCTPSRWYKRSARSFAADREMPNLSAMTEKGTGCGR